MACGLREGTGLNGKLSIIMPAYKEGGRIYSSVAETVRTMKDLGYSSEIIVVDDGSPDDTFEEAKRAALRFENVKAVRYTNNGGKGNALKYGFKYATGDLVAFLDADLDLHPKQLKTFVEIMEKTGADVVIGSKRHPESNLDYPFQRRFLSRGYSLLIKGLFNLPVTDTQTGLKLFKHKVLAEVFPKVLVKRYAFDLELLVNVRIRGYKIAEAPITINFQRKLGRIGFKDIEPIAKDTATVFYRLKVLRYYYIPDKNDRRKVNLDCCATEVAE